MAKTRGNPFLGAAKPKRRSSGRRRAVSRGTFISQSRGVSSEQKAMYHNILGAGRKGVIRKFFDLNTSDQSALRDGLERLVGARVRRP